jgi:hypothetical protein
MHAREPPMNVIWFPQTPGVPFMPSEGDIHRSGLQRSNRQLANLTTTKHWKFRVLEFGGVRAPNVLRRVHRVDRYPDLVTRVQLHDSPISQGKYDVLDCDPF